MYGCIYLLFEAYPIVFAEGHGFNAGVLGLMFLPLFVGGALAVFAYLAYWNPRYERLAREFAPNPVPPEYRLEVCMVAAPVFAISFFWFGWTSYPSVSYWAPLSAGIPLGASIIFIFLGLFNYLIDAYLFVAASALAAVSCFRSLAGFGFPLFAPTMYNALGYGTGDSILGAVAIVVGCPAPWIFWKYGQRIRQASKYARS